MHVQERKLGQLIILMGYSTVQQKTITFLEICIASGMTTLGFMLISSQEELK